MRSKMRGTLAILSLLAGTAIGGTVSAQAPETPPRIEGEVIRVMQQTRAGGLGSLDALTIRTRQGEQRLLLLGEVGSCEGCIQVGDRIRARLHKDGSTASAYAVRTMTVERTREKLRFRDASGQLLRVESRDRSGDGVARQDRRRDRIHQPAGGSAGAGRRGGQDGRSGGQR